MGLSDKLRTALEVRRQVQWFRGQDPRFRDLVFFSEGPEYWDYFAPVIERLLAEEPVAISYLASRREDPGLGLRHERYRAFFIGEGAQRTALFRTLDATVLVLTMPDLGKLYLKRSLNDVEYVYLFHSMVSTHMTYRKGAFDHYDVVCCVGPHHVKEIRATEARYGLPGKELEEVGYPRLDRQLQDARAAGSGKGAETTVLVAPSWGDHALFETIGEVVVARLLEWGFRVILRPHPQTSKRNPEVVGRLRAYAAAEDRLSFDGDVGSYDSLRDADIMISDWSGSALEFAFAYEKPVLFVDVQRKVRNPEYEKIGIEPLEVSVREWIGRVVHPDNLEAMGAVIQDLLADQEGIVRSIRDARARYLFNEGGSAEKTVSVLVKRVRAHHGD